MKSGRSGLGTQRYRCRNPECSTKTFMLAYRYKACEPGIKDQVVDMAINGSGIRDTARVLKINKNTVINTLKKVGRHRPSQSQLRSLKFGRQCGSESGTRL